MGVRMLMMPRVMSSITVYCFMSRPGIAAPTLRSTGSSVVTCAVMLANM